MSHSAILMREKVVDAFPGLGKVSNRLRPDFEPNTELPRHGWYRFKEGFSADLVQSFIRDHMPKAGRGCLLDPFLGSGTTAVEGARLGYDVHGIETNPFMAFVAKVKTGDYSSVGNLEAAATRCLKNRARGRAFLLPTDTTLVERRGLTKWLLNKGVAVRFEQLRTAIARVSEKASHDLLLLALMSSIEAVSNARKDGKCWRYKRNWQQARFDGDALDNAFAAQVIRFSEDIFASPRLSGRTVVTRADARVPQTASAVDVRYDGILTSPPYLNSFDYTDIYRPELLMLKEARNATELRKLRFATVRSHVQVAWQPSAQLEIPLLQKTIRKITGKGLWSQSIPEMVNAYFVDLDQVVCNCTRFLKRGAMAGFVVADSAYCGVVVPVGIILGKVLERRGFTLTATTVLRSNSGNGHHQQRSNERLREVMVLARFTGAGAG